MRKRLRAALAALTAGLACRESPPERRGSELAPLRPGAAAVLRPLEERVDACRRAGGGWGDSARACVCPSGAKFRGARLSCHVGEGFVAFDGDGLPLDQPPTPRAGGGVPAGHRTALAYAPDRWPQGYTEFGLGGFATLANISTPVPRWYYVSVCTFCD